MHYTYFHCFNIITLEYVNYPYLTSNFLGRPKFKITEHPDGYSIQFGMAGYYMRGRYTTSDNSIDFNIMDHKGSIKYVINEWRPGMNKHTYIINDTNFCDNHSCILTYVF